MLLLLALQAFENPAAKLAVDPKGGVIREFRFKDGVNPLHAFFGHFLCCDRWGPPTPAEAKNGMPDHGEAWRVAWTAEGEALLPLAGLAVRREIRLHPTEAVALVRETVTNRNKLGRAYNAVQHPTLGPPFLDAGTLVDCNGTKGFAQGGPEEPATPWPKAGDVDLRRFAADDKPEVVSYIIEDEIGWVTACSKGLLIGYLWKTKDYPWISHWRMSKDGKPAARGLEFGTTGLHEPFPVLLKKGRIYDRPLTAWLDAGESSTRSYTMFLLKVPADGRGIATLKVDGDRLRLRERDGEREWVLEARGYLP